MSDFGLLGIALRLVPKAIPSPGAAAYAPVSIPSEPRDLLISLKSSVLGAVGTSTTNGVTLASVTTDRFVGFFLRSPFLGSLEVVGSIVAWFLQVVTLGEI
jgi:hypothetical protein